MQFFVFSDDWNPYLHGKFVSVVGSVFYFIAALPFNIKSLQSKNKSNHCMARKLMKGTVVV